jgi:tetratricopeptide (TPR) repeat protein
MVQILVSALKGKGQILRLEGEPGVGKSHLAAEFTQRALSRGFRVSLGICRSTTQGIAYYPWRGALRALFGLPDEPFPAAPQEQIARIEAVISKTNSGWHSRLPVLGDLLGLSIPDNATTAALTPEIRQRWLFALVVEMIQTWARTAPLLLLIEDAHWMDEVSQSLTLAVARALASAPACLMLVHRSQEERLLSGVDRLPYSHVLHLGELSPPAVSELLAHRLGGRISELAVSLIQAQAQGNPFFSEELAAALCESGDFYRQTDGTWTLSEPLVSRLRGANCLARANGGWVVAPGAPLSGVDLGIPVAVDRVVLARIDRLPEAHKLTLKVASVIGQSFELDVLARAYPLQPAPEALGQHMAAMQERDLVHPELPGRRIYRFKHAITQEVAYGTLLSEQQLHLHHLVGESLEYLQPEAVERLAYHYSSSGTRDKALLYLDRAARKAQREYANQTALNYYEQALSLEKRAEWLKGKAEVAHILGQREEEQATLRLLEETPGAPTFDIAYLWGQYYEVVSDYSPAQAAIEQAIRACRNLGDTPGEVRCLSQLGLIARKQGEYAKARAWYEQALALLRDTDFSPSEQTQALNGLGTIYRQQGEFDAARQCYEQALALSHAAGNRLGEAEAFNNLGVTAFYQSHFAEAGTYHRQALEIRRAIGDRAGEGISLGNLASVTRDAGDYVQALGYFSEALTIQKAIGNRWDEANVWNDTGVIYLLVGDLAQAGDCFEKSQQISREIGDEAGEVYFLGNLGLVTREKGDLEEAEKLLTDSLVLAYRCGERQVASLALSHLAILSLAAGRTGQAIERADQALTLRRELDLHLWTTADLATLAAAHLQLGDGAKALDYAGQALAILDECSGVGPEYPQRDYFVCYQVLASAGRQDAAQAALQSAYQWVIARAEQIADATLRRSFLEQVPINRKIVQEYAKNNATFDF